MGQKARQIIGWSIVGILALFIVFNLRDVEVHFVMAKVTMPIAFVILFSAALGAGAVFAFQFYRKVRGDDSPK